MKMVLLQRYVSRDHVEVLAQDQECDKQHVAHILFHGWQTMLELGMPIPPGNTAVVQFPNRELRVCYHRVDIPGREAEWYSVEGDDERYDSVLEIVGHYQKLAEKTDSGEEALP